MSWIRKRNPTVFIAVIVVSLWNCSSSIGGVYATTNDGGGRRRGWGTTATNNRQQHTAKRYSPKRLASINGGGSRRTTGARRHHPSAAVVVVQNRSKQPSSRRRPSSSSLANNNNNPKFELYRKRLEEIAMDAMNKAAKSKQISKFMEHVIWFGVVAITSLVEGFVLGYIFGAVWGLPQLLKEQQEEANSTRMTKHGGSENSIWTWHGRSWKWAKKYGKISFVVKMVSILPNVIARTISAILGREYEVPANRSSDEVIMIKDN